jgi:NADH:ubiquinone oxidoreductase subunit F (NADH-binding)/NADH:ubiquinone oxidoreductase subunit E
MLIQSLHDIQNRFGFLPDRELRALADKLQLPLSRVEEVSTFFPSFRLERTNPPEISARVCQDLACHMRGAAALLDEKTGLPALAARLSSQTGKSVCVEGTSCLGRCDRPPVVRAEVWSHGGGARALRYCGRGGDELERALTALAEGREPPAPDTDAAYEPHTNSNRAYSMPAGDAGSAPLATAGWSLDVYGRQKWPRDYRAVKRFTDYLKAILRPLLPPPREMGGRELDAYVQKYHPLLWELRTSNLLGMGGAGMPVYQKWLDVWREPGPEKYVVCNGNDSEPGTFKDRELLLRMPHLVVEGVVLACLMVGAGCGIIAIRHDHAEQIAAIREEIRRAERLNACGSDVFETGRNVEVSVVAVPGGYVCGEQSALLEVLEGRRGLPRNRPPELTTNGFRDRPTAVNNVETFAWVPGITLFGGATYEASGWRLPSDRGIKFGGRRLYSVCGDVVRPGVYEVETGLALGALINGPNYCGGITGGRPLKAVATSGPSGGFLPARLPVDPNFDARRAEAIDRVRARSQDDATFLEWYFDQYLPEGATDLDILALPLDLVFFRHMNGALRLPIEPMLGAGILVCARGTDVPALALNATAFYRRETCGKCAPCRLGVPQLADLGTDLLARRDAGTLTADAVRDTERDVYELARTLQLTSICGLGYAAPIPLATALTYFRKDVLRKPK